VTPGTSRCEITVLCGTLNKSSRACVDAIPVGSDPSVGSERSGQCWCRDLGYWLHLESTHPTRRVKHLLVRARCS
jgi:hypothetical protein